MRTLSLALKVQPITLKEKATETTRVAMPPARQATLTTSGAVLHSLRDAFVRPVSATAKFTLNAVRLNVSLSNNYFGTREMIWVAPFFSEGK